MSKQLQWKQKDSSRIKKDKSGFQFQFFQLLIMWLRHRYNIVAIGQELWQGFIFGEHSKSFRKHLPCSWWTVRTARITQLVKSCILVMVKIPMGWLDQANTCICMFAHTTVHPCVFGRLRASVECGWNMVPIWLNQPPRQLAPLAYSWPFGQTKAGGASWAWGWGLYWQGVRQAP